MSQDLTYNEYLRVPEILSLQNRRSDPPHHDEMLFIVIHQAYELWFKLILHEIDQAVGFMESGESLRARHYIERMVQVMKLAVSQIHILETMAPADFLGFRDRINPASGFQSVQFREIEFALGIRDEKFFSFFEKDRDATKRLRKRFDEPSLGERYFEHLKQCRYVETISDETILSALKRITEAPKSHLPVYLLAESLLSLDENLSLFRFHHVRVVERVIGRKRGTGGSSGVEYLKSTLEKRAFPLLWEVRTILEPKK